MVWLLMFVLLPCRCCPCPRPFHPFSEDCGHRVDCVVHSLHLLLSSSHHAGEWCPGCAWAARSSGGASGEGDKDGHQGWLLVWVVELSKIIWVRRRLRGVEGGWAIHRVPTNSVDSLQELYSKWRDNLFLNSLKQTSHVVCPKWILLLFTFFYY